MEMELKTEWTLWYDKTDLNICDNNWDQFLIKIESIFTIDNFWALFNNTPLISDLPSGSNYHFFKTGIEPKWEDLENLDGGRWVLSLSKVNIQDCEKIWEFTVLALISERFTLDGSQIINGVVANVRKNEVRFSIWTKNASKKALQIKIGKFWQKFLREEIESKEFLLEYFPHSTD